VGLPPKLFPWKPFPWKRITLTGAFLAFLAAAILLAYIPEAGAIGILATIGAILTGLLLAVRLSRLLVRGAIWRLRNRLIVTYVFIGVVPLVLVLALVAIGAYIFVGQTAVFLVSSELNRTIDVLAIPARVLTLNAHAPHVAVLDQVAPFIRQRFPSFQVVIRRDGQILHYPLDSTLPTIDESVPDYTGLTVLDRQYYACSHSRTAGMIVDVIAPVERDMLGELVPRLGEVGILQRGGGVRLAQRRLPASRRFQPDSVPPPTSQFDYEVNWASRLPVIDWGTGKRLEDINYLWIITRPSALLGAITTENSTVAEGALDVFIGVAILFFLVEIVSALIGVSLTRTITGAISELYDGTQRVAEGDFSHPIRVKGKDQLAAVSESFNSMTERLERLVIVEKEKERLQSELEIAREVQNQLFPRTSPHLATIDITGLCRPARMVSGDYYDYLCLQDSRLAFAIGDVAGKGISAALLMASIQSIMQTQLSAATPVMAASAGGSPHAVYSTSHMVSLLNRQLYANTAPEKYATFLFGIYDDRERSLTYTNAGHLPPILIRRGQPNMLEVTGTVVGAFPFSRYEEQTILLEPEDLLVCYTDGITEPENEYGEEFGTERLVEALLRHHKLEPGEILTEVMDAVRAWTAAPELPDDMTLVLARRNAL
jgi:sigma-B regulation protein RsbU (phosphoserine phosphatase)